MFTPDKFQVDAVNDVKKGNNVLVVAPTGSGKTYIAEKSIDYYLSKQKNIFYTTPIKALSNQKYNDFNRQGIRTGLLTGDRSIDKDAELVIATTEILRNMIFSKDSKLNDTGLIILDEVHYLADKERGTTWEEILIHANKDIKFLSLSATINNKNEFLEWLVSLRGTTSLIHSSTRPIPLEISLVASSKSSRDLKIIKSTKDKKNKNIFKIEKKNSQFNKPNLREQALYLNSRNLLPVIFFYFSRERVESSARQLSNNFKLIENRDEIKDKYDEVFGDLTTEELALLNLDEHMWMWSRGVGYHHAGLAPIVKEFVEYLFLNKYIKFLFATETLALGINMPAKAIFIDRLHKYDGIKTRPITQSEFLQLSGRAGRRGIDDKGYAFLSYDRRKLEELFNGKHNVLKDLGFIDSIKGKVLKETYRDNLIPAIHLYHTINNQDIEMKLMYVSSGISNEKLEFTLKDEFNDLFNKFYSSIEKVNKIEYSHGIKKPTQINLSWFSVFYEYMKSGNIEYVINKFNLNIGDFIKVAKEASEISKKLSIIYEDDSFEDINKIFDNNLIQKTMS